MQNYYWSLSSNEKSHSSSSLVSESAFLCPLALKIAGGGCTFCTFFVLNGAKFSTNSRNLHKLETSANIHPSPRGLTCLFDVSYLAVFGLPQWPDGPCTAGRVVATVVKQLSQSDYWVPHRAAYDALIVSSYRNFHTECATHCLYVLWTDHMLHYSLNNTSHTSISLWWQAGRQYFYHTWNWSNIRM